MFIRMKSIKVDVLVIGAGPSGCVSASLLHQSGLKVLVVEKEKFPRFVIGESLLPRSMETLERAGFVDVLKTKGFQEKFGAKFVRNEDVCDFNFSDQHTQGWSWTWQVPRADFDLAISQELQAKGVDILFEHTVTGIEFKGSDSTTTIVNKDNETIQVEAKFIVDSSGYGRVIPRLFNLDKPSNLPMRKTVFTHITDSNRLDYAEPNRIIVVVVKQDIWVWLIPFSNGNTSLGFVGDPEFFKQFEGATTDEQLWNMINSNDYLKERFAGQKFTFEPRTIEGWSVTTEKFYGDGFVLTGNVTEFLDPIFSSGVTLAVVSGEKAANIVINKIQGQPYDWEKDFMEPTMRGVNVFRSYVMGWYNGSLQDIFFTSNINPVFKNQICSVLAGYVWDETNPFVKKHDTLLKTLSEVIKLQEK
jgi:flavin-dependent dehydrogenase